MKRLMIVVLIAIATVAAIMHFWPTRDPQPIAPSANTPLPDSPPAHSGSAAPVQPAQTAPAPSLGHAAPSGALQLPPAAAARFELSAPERTRHLDTFVVPIDIQALRSMRNLEFAVTYKKSVLRLLGSTPGALAHQNGIAVDFEESSEGHLIVRVDLKSGVHAITGNIALLEFQARNRGVSPLAVEEVSYVDDGGQHTTITPEVQVRSIAVD